MPNSLGNSWSFHAVLRRSELRHSRDTAVLAQPQAHVAKEKIQGAAGAAVPSPTLREAAEASLRSSSVGAAPAADALSSAAASASHALGLVHELQGHQVDVTLAKATAVLVAAESLRTERALALNRVLLEVRDFDADDVASYVCAVTETTARAVGAARVSLWAAELEGTVLQCRGRFDAGSGVHEPGRSIRVAEYPRYFAALQESDVLAADDAIADPRTNEFATGCLDPLDITSMLDAPLRVGGRLAGVVCIEHRGPARRWSAEEQSFAHALANIALHALAHIERGHAVAARQISERQLRTLLDGMDDRAWLKDAQGRYLALNRSEALALGVSAEQALGKTIQELRPDVALRGHAAEDARALASSVPTRVERPAAFGGGWLEIVSAQLLGDDGSVQGLVGIARDITERKRIELALLESEARFRALTEMSSDWYWETDPQGSYTMMVGRDGKGPNLRFGDTIGRDSRELQALTGAQREQLSPNPVEYARALAEHRSCRDALSKWTFPDGNVTFVRFSFEPMFGADGEFRGFRGVSSDVTQRERDAQALAQVHHQLEQAMSTSGIAFHEWNLSANLMTIRGLPGPAGPSSLVERSKGEALALIHPDDAALVQRVYDEVRRGVVRSVEAEYRVRGAGGQWRWRRLQAQLVEVDPQSGVPLRAAGTSSDIDSRKRAELALTELNRELEARIASRTEALAQSEARFRVMMSDAPVGILIVAPDRTIVDANPRACDILGRPPQALIGMGIEQVTHPDDWPANAALAAPMEQGQLPRFALEKRYLRGDASVVWVRLHVAAVNDAQGKFLYRIAVIEDITQRREADARLSEYSAQVSALSGRLLRAQEDERRHLARELHDEIGQALTAAQMALGSVERRFAPAGDDSAIAAAKSVLRDAIKGVRTMWHELRPRVFDDLGLVVGLRGLCAQTQGHSQMTVEFQVQGDATAIPTPLGEVLYRVCQEALTNAARHARATRVEVQLRESAGKVSLRVHDNGVGFDTTSQARATDRLGLVGMRERIRLLEGTLRIDSTPDKGTLVCAEFAGARSAASPTS